jgi:hypothetical protein
LASEWIAILLKKRETNEDEPTLAPYHPNVENNCLLAAFIFFRIRHIYLSMLFPIQYRCLLAVLHIEVLKDIGSISHQKAGYYSKWELGSGL